MYQVLVPVTSLVIWLSINTPKRKRVNVWPFLLLQLQESTPSHVQMPEPAAVPISGPQGLQGPGVYSRIAL